MVEASPLPFVPDASPAGSSDVLGSSLRGPYFPFPFTLASPAKGTVQAFAASRLVTTPSADFWHALQITLRLLPVSRPRTSSPGVIPTTSRAQPRDLLHATLTDMDFAVTRPLVRDVKPHPVLVHWLALLLHASSRLSPLRFANLHLRQVGRRLQLPSCRSCPAHECGAFPPLLYSHRRCRCHQRKVQRVPAVSLVAVQERRESAALQTLRVVRRGLGGWRARTPTTRR
jgi:hypothetical protein